MEEAVFVGQYTFLVTPQVFEEEERILGKIARRLRCEYVIRFEDDGKFYFLLETRSGYEEHFARCGWYIVSQTDFNSRLTIGMGLYESGHLAGFMYRLDSGSEDEARMWNSILLFTFFHDFRTIIFLTASPDYAIESYEVQASGYLLKSFSEEKLMKLLNRILKTDMKRRVAIKNRRQYRYPCTDDIMYIDSNKHNVTLHLSDGSEIITVDKLGEIEKRINEKRFLRCHQSYLVNMDYIKDVEDDFIMEDGTLVPIRVRGRKEILDTYYDYFVNHFGDSKDTFAE